ncbi:CxxC motif-containing protein [Oscillospiraceae bacterium]|nr:CxxC motif-containing protein [Oscillospiraceae bacterium]
MTKKELTCIGCPMGCEIEVMLEDDGRIASVTGNTCRRGDVYARKEIEAPRRIVTSTIKVTGSLEGASCVSCKTETDIPKEKIFDVISELKGTSLPCPVKIGDIVLSNAAGTGVDVIATSNVR